MAMLSIYSVVGHNFYGCSLYPFKRPKRIILISFQNLELLLGRSSSPVGYGIGIADVVGSNPTRSIFINLVKYGIMLNLILVSRTEYIAIYRNAGIVITSTITI